MSNVYVQGGGLAHRISYGPHAKLGNARIVEEEGRGKAYSGHIRLLVILVLFLALLTIASIILSVVSITSWGKKDNSPTDYDHYKNYYYNNNGKDSNGKTPYKPYPYPQSPNNGQSPVVITNSVSDSASNAPIGKDCYTIAFGDDWYRHEFIDEADKCALKGSGPAVALAACEAAGIKCKIVYAPWQHCIDYFGKDEPERQPILGDGLYYDALDGCGGWFPEQERFNVAGFTDGWIRNPNVYLWYKSGTTAPSGSGLNIGFAYAAPWNEKCLKRYLDRLGITGANLISFGGEGSLYETLRDTNQLDLVFLSDLTVGNGGFTNLVNRYPSEPMRCAEGEAGLATRKCSVEFILKFNKGLDVIKHNGVLKELCTNVAGPGPDQDGGWCSDSIVWA